MNKTDDGLVMFSRREGCPHCRDMLYILIDNGLNPQIVYVEDIKPLFTQVHTRVPQLYHNGNYIGDASKMRIANKLNKVEETIFGKKENKQ